MFLQENFENLGVMRLLLRPILDQYDASRRPNDSFHMIAILPIASGRTLMVCRLSDPVCLSAESHTLRW